MHFSERWIVIYPLSRARATFFFEPTLTLPKFGLPRGGKFEFLFLTVHMRSRQGRSWNSGSDSRLEGAIFHLSGPQILKKNRILSWGKKQTGNENIRAGCLHVLPLKKQQGNILEKNDQKLGGDTRSVANFPTHQSTASFPAFKLFKKQRWGKWYFFSARISFSARVTFFETFQDTPTRFPKKRRRKKKYQKENAVYVLVREDPLMKREGGKGGDEATIWQILNSEEGMVKIPFWKKREERVDVSSLLTLPNTDIPYNKKYLQKIDIGGTAMKIFFLVIKFKRIRLHKLLCGHSKYYFFEKLMRQKMRGKGKVEQMREEKMTF